MTYSMPSSALPAAALRNTALPRWPTLSSLSLIVYLTDRARTRLTMTKDNTSYYKKYNVLRTDIDWLFKDAFIIPGGIQRFKIRWLRLTIERGVAGRDKAIF